MKSGLFILLFLVSLWGGLTGIHTRNEAVQAGAQAYQKRQYGAALRWYREALATMKRPEEPVLLNAAHAAWQAQQPGLARTYYSRLLTSRNLPMRSVAQQQLGLLAGQRRDYVLAARFLRQALVDNPKNAAARYNYEAVLRYLNRRPEPEDALPDEPREQTGPQETTPQPKTQQGNQQSGALNDPTRQNQRQPPQARHDARGQQSPNQTGGPGGQDQTAFTPGQGQEQQVAQGRQPGSVRGLGDPTADSGSDAPAGSRQAGSENAAPDAAALQTQRARLQQMQLTPAQAQQLLEALRAAEQQYLQQLPRKAPRRSASSKPAW
ncbi:hypothetical protein FY528_08955 [Hymenobacter lutimineralis]|uniref:Tetratricopeptide repeat protein n=1 Tax=Hymenobacter lutimineralis TaxID=2606448 RepID=A0A5D6V447_9BACT|nr:hypothetical protein [Hymenobacter lutimineralis]TYZ10583.1 hypothetical protein FY528_08955 [Hymenobacter lutimineralis]